MHEGKRRARARRAAAGDEDQGGAPAGGAGPKSGGTGPKSGGTGPKSGGTGPK
jgi:hypothetical protein